MSGPINRENFGERAERNERLALGAGLIVVIGLLVESGPELAHSLINWVSPGRAVIGNLVVALGVAFEVLFSWRTLLAARRVELEANQRIAEALRAAAEANLARVRLESELRKRTVSRLLNKDEADSFVSSLKQFKGQHFAIYWSTAALKTSPSRVAEQLALATQLRELLIETGWEEQLTQLPLNLETPDGVTLYFSSIVQEESETLLLPTVAAAVATEFMRLKISSQVTLHVGIPPQVLVVAIGILP